MGSTRLRSLFSRYSSWYHWGETVDSQIFRQIQLVSYLDPGVLQTVDLLGGLQGVQVGVQLLEQNLASCQLAIYCPTGQQYLTVSSSTRSSTVYSTVH